MLWDVWVIDFTNGAFYLAVPNVSIEDFKETIAEWTDETSLLIPVPAGCLLVRNPLLGNNVFNQRLECCG